jgi:predicted MPP superfamily phosphohydrolase
VAAVGDLHCTKTSSGELQPLFAAASHAADVLLICGDLTDYGLPEEAEMLASEARSALRIPALALLGNHEHESGREQLLSRWQYRTDIEHWQYEDGRLRPHGRLTRTQALALDHEPH